MRARLVSMKQQRLLGLALCSLSLALLSPMFSGVSLATVSFPVLLQFVGGAGAILAGVMLFMHVLGSERAD